MSKLIKSLKKKCLINPPVFIPDTVQYLCITGSVAYGVSDMTSDLDICGFCIPPISILYPHTAGYITGLDDDIPNFSQWQKHNVIDNEMGKVYDFNIFNILKYFKLLMNNNPNILDSLFVSRNFIIHSSKVFEYIRENRNKFLHKGSWFRYRGYSYSQLHKMKIKMKSVEYQNIIQFEDDNNIDRSTKFSDVENEARSNNHDNYKVSSLSQLTEKKLKEYYRLYKAGMEKTKRFEKNKINGHDIKYMYHVVRLLNEAEQILTEHTLDLQKNKEQLKSIRKGEWKKEEVIQYFEEKEQQLEKLYKKSTLKNSPNVNEIKELYLNCLEMQFGSLDNIINRKK